jgi:hypothetical protein
MGETELSKKFGLGAAREQSCSERASITILKALQCAKIAELREVLLRSGYPSLDKQAAALGLSRSTTWAVLQASHKSSGLSGSVIKRMLGSPDLPPAVREWITEYVAEKLRGRYGHSNKRLRIFCGLVSLRSIGQVWGLSREA